MKKLAARHGTKLSLVAVLIFAMILSVSTGRSEEGRLSLDDESVRPDDPVSQDSSLDLSMDVRCGGCEPHRVTLNIEFEYAVDPALVVAAIESSPAVELHHVYHHQSTRVQLRGDFAPETTYRLSIPSGASFGAAGTTGAVHAIELETGPYRPLTNMPAGHVVLGPDRELPVIVRHAEGARLRIIPLGTWGLRQAQSVMGRYHGPGTDPVGELPHNLRRNEQSYPIPVGDADVHGRLQVDPFDTIEGSMAFVVLEAPSLPPRMAIVQRGHHAIVMKIGASRGLVWAVDVRDGTPAARARVTIYQDADERFRGWTDDQGLVRLPAAARLRDRTGSTPLQAVLETNSEIAYTTERFTNGIESWEFNIPSSYSSQTVRGMVTAERGIYRPGETVHLLGVMRRLLPDGRLRPPNGTVEVEVVDPDNTSIAQRTLQLTPFGTFRSNIDIPVTSRLGRYQVTARQGDGSLVDRFEVGEYRANTFEVTLSSPGPAEMVDSNIIVPVSARYLYGAPLRDATVRWSSSARPHLVQQSNLESFSFGDRGHERNISMLSSGEITLDENGQGQILLPESALPQGDLSQAVDILFEATATDAANDAVTARTVQYVTRGDALVGVENNRWSVDSSDGWSVRVVAIDTNGDPVEGEQIGLRLYRRTWMTAAQRVGGGHRYGGHWEDQLVRSMEIESTAQPQLVHLDLDGGGRYRLELLDERDVVEAVARVWSHGPGGSVPIENHPRMELVPDRDSYAPGDTAQVFAQSPWAESLALVTVEREGIIQARSIRLRGSETPIEVPLTEHHLPNVFVSVTAVPIGLGSASPAAGIPLRMGYTELTVSPEERHLTVDIEPDEDEHRPGDEALVNVTITDNRGRPVVAEVTLWAADEGVMQLTGYRNPDPFEPAYARHNSNVMNSCSLVRWVHDDPNTWGAGGDSGPGEASPLRSRFLSTAFFSTGVVTDRRGRAQVAIELPDNLTRWRLLAVAADNGQRFGSSESNLTVAKPLQVMPSLPRFLTQGDQVDIGLVVHNHTGADGIATVSLDVEGAEPVNTMNQQVTVEEGAQAAVRFPLRANMVGDVSIRATVEMGDESDGFERNIPVHSATSWNSNVLGDGFFSGTESLSMTLPEHIKDDQVELIVTISPSVLASMEQGIEALVEYPHGCVEQTTSRLIPMVLLEDLMNDLGSSALRGEAHRRQMEEAIAHVLRHQNFDGGFGLWPSSASEGFLTAYALWGLLTATEHGYNVPPRGIERAESYLRYNRTHGTDMHGQFSDEEIAPFAAFVLARAEQEDGGLGTTLAAGHSDLSMFGVGLLASALSNRGQRQQGITPLFSALESAHQPADQGVLVREGGASYGGLLHVGRDLRATAVSVQALVDAGRYTEAEELVEGILSARRADGTWGHTYNNMWALSALTSWAQAQGNTRANIPISVSINDRVITSSRMTTSTGTRRIVIPASELPSPGTTATVSVSTSESRRLRYSARLRYALEAREQNAESHGFVVTRTILDAETGEAVESPTLGQILRVRVAVETDEHRRQVALVDYLPAGLEAIDTNLATSQRRVLENGSRLWAHREIHDERVSFFANSMPSGRHEAEYLARASRTGTFIRRAPGAEEMYDPDVWGRGDIEAVTVTPTSAN